VITVSSFFVGLAYLFYDFSSVFPDADAFIFYIFAGASFLNIYFMYLVFQWKKMGFYLYCCLAVFASAIYLAIGFTLLEIVVGLIGPIVLYLCMRSQWNQFK
jgi:hypothetical protein